MKTSMMQRMIIAALTVGASASALADDADNDQARNGCSDATLKGLYLTNGSGFTIVAGVAQPLAVVHFVRFDGQGAYTLPAAGTLSVNGIIVHIPANLGGTYTIAADCTGTYQAGFPGGPTFDLYVAPGGAEYRLIQTGPGNPPNVVNVITAERVSR
jgi:hypothetical protein